MVEKRRRRTDESLQVSSVQSVIKHSSTESHIVMTPVTQLNAMVISSCNAETVYSVIHINTLIMCLHFFKTGKFSTT